MDAVAQQEANPGWAKVGIKPATSNQPVVLFSQNKSAPATSHQPNKHAVKSIHTLE
jgi:hypothetical protein